MFDRSQLSSGISRRDFVVGAAGVALASACLPLSALAAEAKSSGKADSTAKAGSATAKAGSAAALNKVTMEGQTLGMEKLGNARQLGGYKTADGRTIKKDVLLRTAALAGASQADLDKLQNTYHLGYVCDFRTTSERQQAPDPELPGVENVWCSIIDESTALGAMAAGAGSSAKDAAAGSAAKGAKASSSADGEVKAASAKESAAVAGGKAAAAAASSAAEKASSADAAAQQKATLEATVKQLVAYADSMDLSTMYDEMADSAHSQQGYRKFFDVLLGAEDGKAVLWHCTAGKDRAGLGAVLLLSALGVDEGTALDDFALTNDFNAKQTEAMVQVAKGMGCTDAQIQAVRDLSGVNRAYMEHTLRHIDEAYGGMSAYLADKITLTADELKKLQEKYLQA